MGTLMVVAGLHGCTLNGGGTTEDIEPLPTTPDTFPLPPAELVVGDGNVHTYEASWLFPTITITPGSDVYVGWDAVTTDAYGVTWEVGAFPVLALFEVGVARTEMQEHLANDTFDAVLVDAWTLDVDGVTDVALSDFPGFDPIAAFTPDDAKTWLLALCDRQGARLDPRAGLILDPDTAGSGVFIDIPNGVTRFEWSGKLDGDLLRTASGYGAYPVDWSAVTTDGYGQAFDPARADELFVGRYDDVAEADDLAAELLTLEAAATEWWSGPIAGGATDADLMDLTGTGGGFPGFEGDVAYVVGARCTTCFGPAPLWVAAIDVTAAP